MGYKIKLTSELLPILDVGMYQTLLDPKNLFGYIIETLDEDNREEVDFDFESYVRDVSQLARRMITEELHQATCKYGVNTVTVGEIVCPATYNFTSDYIEINLHVSDDFCQNIREQIDEWRKVPNWEIEADKMIKESWGSYSGFMSYMPQSVKEIYEFEDDVRCTAEFLCFALHYSDNELIEYDKFDGFTTSESLQWCFIDLCQNELEYESYAKLEHIYPEEIWAMYSKKPDELDALIWDLFYAGVLNRGVFSEANRTDSAIDFLEWCKKNNYETIEELRELLNQSNN